MRKIFRRRNNKIYFTVLKGYVLFTLLTVVMIVVALVILLVGFTDSIKSGRIPEILPSQIINEDYINIDASDLIDIGGYAEIINSDGDIIHIIGDQSIKKSHYTPKEIISMQNTIDMGYSSSFIIGYTEKTNTTYYTVGEYFIGHDGYEYLCITKIPKEAINIQISFKNMVYNDFPGFYNPFILGVIVFFVLFIINLLIFASWLMKKVMRPLDTIHKGIDQLSTGNIDTKIDVKGEQEFVKIGNAFNTMTNQLKNNLSERERLEQARQDMLVHISHDIKTPITSIQGYSKILLEDIVASEEKKKEYLEHIFNKTEKLTAIVDTLCEYVKLDHEIDTPALQTHDFVETIRGVVAFCYSEIEDKQMKLIMKLPDHDIMLTYDKTQIERAIMNIMSNAIKYNPSETTITLKLNQTDTSVITEIIDDGIGIPNDQVATIFDPFIRGDQARGSEGGTGLGLAITKKIIERHKGSLELITNRSVKEKTVFRLTIDN